jgi:hypothetical protein
MKKSKLKKAITHAKQDLKKHARVMRAAAQATSGSDEALLELARAQLGPGASKKSLQEQVRSLRAQLAERDQAHADMAARLEGEALPPGAGAALLEMMSGFQSALLEGMAGAAEAAAPMVEKAMSSPGYQEAFRNLEQLGQDMKGAQAGDAGSFRRLAKLTAGETATEQEVAEAEAKFRRAFRDS